VDLCGHSEVTIHFRSFSVDYYNAKACPLGLVLCECGIRIVGFEILDLLEVRLLLNGTHILVR
jgi:hypothetical protein